MAINPNDVNILNVNELNDAVNIQDTDLIIVGQGIYARKSTILALYNKFGIDAIKDDVIDLQDRLNDIELLNPVLFTPQILNSTEQKQARDNIDAVGNPEMQATQVPDWSTNITTQINF